MLVYLLTLAIVTTFGVVQPSAAMTTFQNCKKRAERIDFDDYATPSEKLVSRLKWLSSGSRIANRKAVLVSKSQHLLVPAYIIMLFTYQSNCLYSSRSETQGKLMEPKEELNFINEVYHLMELRLELKRNGSCDTVLS